MTPTRSAPEDKPTARKTAVAKPAAKSTGKTATPPTAKADAAADTPFLRFHPSKDLHDRLVRILDLIDAAEDATTHRTKLAELASELTAAGLDYYFLRSLKVAKVGFVTQQSANLGIAGVQQVMAPVIRNIVGRLEHAQLQSVARTIRELMA
jgi:hypothetical protein